MVIPQPNRKPASPETQISNISVNQCSCLPCSNYFVPLLVHCNKIQTTIEGLSAIDYFNPFLPLCYVSVVVSSLTHTYTISFLMASIKVLLGPTTFTCNASWVMVRIREYDTLLVVIFGTRRVSWVGSPNWFTISFKILIGLMLVTCSNLIQ